ncbi:hypothetical protein ACEUZ9_000876 [Paracoccus litorisediminis]|uniref:hypothetical protein n=1 Tax=Paracoccus litorisediminis TaxID=2006130 RepID=UPI00372D9C39
MAKHPLSAEILIGETEHLKGSVTPEGHVRLVIDFNPHDPGLPAVVPERQARAAGSALDEMLTVFMTTFGGEIEAVASDYGTFLRGDVAQGRDPELQERLERIRLQNQILSGVEMADPAQACTFLGLSGANPSAALKRREAELMRFTIEGRVRYPIFQFEDDERRVYPAFAAILREAFASEWSNFRLLNWMMRPHLDFDDTPAKALGKEGDAVYAAFLREARPEMHG